MILLCVDRGLVTDPLAGRAGKIVRLMRVMRILRIFKMVRHFVGLQSLIYTLHQVSSAVCSMQTRMYSIEYNVTMCGKVEGV